MYAENMSGLELFENKYSYEIFRNQFESGDAFIASLNQFSFEYIWYLDTNELKFVSENFEDDKAMIDELLDFCKPHFHHYQSPMFELQNSFLFPWQITRLSVLVQKMQIFSLVLIFMLPKGYSLRFPYLLLVHLKQRNLDLKIILL